MSTSSVSNHWNGTWTGMWNGIASEIASNHDQAVRLSNNTIHLEVATSEILSESTVIVLSNYMMNVMLLYKSNEFDKIGVIINSNVCDNECKINKNPIT